MAYGVAFEPAQSEDGMQPLQHSDGVLRCPRGYPLRKIDANTYRCDGGFHEYHLDEQELIFDKFGNVLVKNNQEADDAEKE